MWPGAASKGHVRGPPETIRLGYCRGGRGGQGLPQGPLVQAVPQSDNWALGLQEKQSHVTPAEPMTPKWGGGALATDVPWEAELGH